MFPTLDDFRLKASNFDLRRPENILRIVCGAFYFPHVAGKFTGLAFNAGTLKFFAAAGMSPPELWLGLAAIGELATAVALILGLCTRWAALVSVVLLAVAVYALQVVKGFGWTWNTGGYEYPVFWAIVSLCVAMQAWQAYEARATVRGGIAARAH